MLNKGRVIEVYLDSSDYSDLSNQEKINKDSILKSIRNNLIKFSSLGLINIRYSIISISEVTHVSTNVKIYAVNRAKIIDKLSLGKTLYDIKTLERLDAINLISNLEKGITTDSYPYAFNSQGDWFPTISVSTYQFKADMISELRSEIKKLQYSRNERKRIEKLFIKQGELTKSAVDFIVSKDLGIEGTFSNYFPIDKQKNHEEVLKLFLLGKISGEALFKAMRLNFMDVVSFIEWFVDNASDGFSMNWMRDYALTEVETFTKLKKEFQSLKESYDEIGYTEKEALIQFKKMLPIFPKQREQLLINEWENNKHLYIQHGVTKKKWRTYILNSIIGDLPMFDTYNQLRESYMVNTILTFKDGRKFKISDTGDILHAQYMPYVDFFRCDKFMKPLISPLAKRYKTQVVSSLNELMIGINEELDKRNLKI